MQLVLFLCLQVVLHYSCGLTKPDNECCQTKSVGSVEYVLAETQDTSSYGCINDCTYTKLADDPGSQKYCFKTGDLPVYCEDKTPNTGEPSFALLVGGASYNTSASVPAIGPTSGVEMIPVQSSACYVPGLDEPSYGNTLVLTPQTIIWPSWPSKKIVNRLLNCGGLNNNMSCLILVVAKSQGAWQYHSNFTKPRNRAIGVTLPTGTYLFGGDFSPNTTDFLPASKNKWLSGPVPPGGTGAGCGVAVSDTELMVISSGGNGVNKYSTKNNEWTTMGRLTVERRGHACTLFRDQIIVAGGVVDNNMPVATTDIIPLSTGIPRSGGNLNTPRAFFAMVTLGSKVLAIGGTTDKVYLASIEEWLEDEDKWETSPINLSAVKSSFGAIAIPTSLICPKN